ALERRTEGWIVGLQLSALSLHGHTNPAAFVDQFTGSHSYIIDYLVEEVLQRQDPAAQQFLLQTSLLGRLCGPLCDAVTARTDSQAQLEQLQRANLFLIPLDEQRQWYRYHHLFAEVLQQWLRQQAPALIPQLHRRACHWYETQGLLADAIHHALAADDLAHAADLVELTADQLRKHGEFVTLNALLDRLPDAMVAARPHLALAR
ncbi:MAG: helix-turn-helix transcriptional regulator, partial [Anaerolineae bacterium]|nr:helix-turn-helix transcriptional regulator [Anaerolineae bacterium]